MGGVKSAQLAGAKCKRVAFITLSPSQALPILTPRHRTAVGSLITLICLGRGHSATRPPPPPGKFRPCEVARGQSPPWALRWREPELPGCGPSLRPDFLPRASEPPESGLRASSDKRLQLWKGGLREGQEPGSRLVPRRPPRVPGPPARSCRGKGTGRGGALRLSASWPHYTSPLCSL